MNSESCFPTSWKILGKHKSGTQERLLIGFLAFEAGSLMSKLVHLWHSLSDENVAKLKVEAINNLGVKKLISEDNDFIIRLICAEMIQTTENVAKSAAILAKRCTDPSLRGFKRVFDKIRETGADPFGWEFTWKEMDKKVKEMERFISVNPTLYQEMEMLANLKETLRSMNGSNPETEKLLDQHKTLVWKQQELKNLKEMSLWNRTYDYTVCFLARSLFTIYSRIDHVFGINLILKVQSSVLSELDRLNQVGHITGCLASSNSSSVSNCCLSSADANTRIVDKAKERNAGHLPWGNIIPTSRSIFLSQHQLLEAVPETLGAAALALRYANVIVIIEKLAASPYLIGHDARDDLYNMLPASVRAALRERLKPYSKSLGSSVYDTVLAGEWTEAIASILEWLAPLAHNMIRWQSERSYEQQNFVSRTNVLLVQTLYFANQEKTEATITELLVGLNYIWRFERELNAKALRECASSRVFESPFPVCTRIQGRNITGAIAVESLITAWSQIIKQ